MTDAWAVTPWIISTFVIAVSFSVVGVIVVSYFIHKRSKKQEDRNISADAIYKKTAATVTDTSERKTIHSKKGFVENEYIKTDNSSSVSSKLSTDLAHATLNISGDNIEPTKNFPSVHVTSDNLTSGSCQISVRNCKIGIKSYTSKKYVLYITGMHYGSGDTRLPVFTTVLNNDSPYFKYMDLVNARPYQVICCSNHALSYSESCETLDFRCEHCQTLVELSACENDLSVNALDSGLHFITSMKITGEDESLTKYNFYNGQLRSVSIPNTEKFTDILVNLHFGITSGVDAVDSQFPDINSSSSPLSLEERLDDNSAFHDDDMEEQVYSRYVESFTDSLMRTLVEESDDSVSGCPYDSITSVEGCQDLLTDSLSQNASPKSTNSKKASDWAFEQGNVIELLASTCTSGSENSAEPMVEFESVSVELLSENHQHIQPPESVSCTFQQSREPSEALSNQPVEINSDDVVFFYNSSALGGSSSPNVHSDSQSPSDNTGQ